MNYRKRFFCLLAFTSLISILSLVLLIKGNYFVKLFNTIGGVKPSKLTCIPCCLIPLGKYRQYMEMKN